MLQRDYVQGLDINASKRDSFLKSIFSSLAGLPDDNGKPYSGKMDFLYGSSSKQNLNNADTSTSDTADTHDLKRFMPIDGQQRLTTLALVGWLLAQKSELKDYKIPKLCYRTRHTTEQFCDHLFSYNLPENYGDIRTHITNEPLWMAGRWLSDPSVNAMLELLSTADRMLESDIYKGHINDMADRFFNDSPLMFELLDMEEYNLTEDLYIKMNARGKHLSSFENWKAEFTGMLEADYKDMDYSFRKVDDTILTVPEYFSYAIEHEWTDLLWAPAFRKWNALPDEEKERHAYPRIDEQFMSLLDLITKTLFRIGYPASADLSDNPNRKDTEKQDPAKRFDGEKGEWISARRIDVFRRKGCNSDGDNVIRLFGILDILCDISRQSREDMKYTEEFTPDKEWFCFFDSLLYSGRWDCTSDKINILETDGDVDLFNRCLSSSLTVPLEVLLWGILEYCRRFDVNRPTERLKNYTRVFWGWILAHRQRLQAKELGVKHDLRADDYPELSVVIDALTADEDVYAALEKLSTADDKKADPDIPSARNALKDEIMKARMRESMDAKEFDILLGCHYLKGDISNLLPAMAVLTGQSGKLFSRFVSFYKLREWEKTRELVRYGWKGESVVHNNYRFYGKNGHWDYVFSSSGKTIKDAITGYLCEQERVSLSPCTKEYYIEKYKDFYDTHRWDNEISHFFYVPADFYITSLLATFTCRVPGYQQCPYSYTVYTALQATDPDLCKKLNLIDSYEKSDHGCLKLNNEKYWIECVEEGWRFDFPKGDRWESKWASRFEQNQEDLWTDKEGEFRFEIGDDTYNILCDSERRDRIENCIAFLKALHSLLS